MARGSAPSTCCIRFQGVVQTMHAAPLAIEAEDGRNAARAGRLLAEVQRRAEAAGVACDGKYVSSNA